MMKKGDQIIFVSYVYAAIIALALHALFFYSVFSLSPAPQKSLNRARLVARTIDLTPRKQAEPSRMKQPQQEIASIDSTVQRSAEEIEKKNSVPEVKPDKTEAKKEAPVQTKVKEPPKKSVTPEQNKAKPKPKPKKAEPKKTDPKKKETPAKQPQAKPQPKSEPKKSPTPPVKKPAPKEVKIESQSKPSPKPTETKPPQPSKAEIAAKEAAKARQKELLAKAQENLAKIGKTRDKVSSSPSAFSDKSTLPQLVGGLEIDALPSLKGGGALTAKEGSYRDEVAFRLKLALKLPDYGKIKMKLILDRSGKVKTYDILSSESSKNREYIERSIRTLAFPNFGTNFEGLSEYTFIITLHNEN